MIVERRNSHQPDSHDLLSEIREIMNEPIPFVLEEILAIRYTARAVIHQDDVFTKITVSMEDIKHEEENNLRFQNSSKKLRALMQKYRDINPCPIRDTPEDISFCREVEEIMDRDIPEEDVEVIKNARTTYLKYKSPITEFAPGSIEQLPTEKQEILRENWNTIFFPLIIRIKHLLYDSFSTLITLK